MKKYTYVKEFVGNKVYFFRVDCNNMYNEFENGKWTEPLITGFSWYHKGYAYKQEILTRQQLEDELFLEIL